MSNRGLLPELRLDFEMVRRVIDRRAMHGIDAESALRRIEDRLEDYRSDLRHAHQVIAELRELEAQAFALQAVSLAGKERLHRAAKR